MLVTQAAQPAGNDFFTAARNAGNKWNYGSIGIGSSTHLAGELLASKAGLEAVHVPFNGAPAVINAMIGGAVEAVRDGESGLLVNGENVAEIAEAIKRVLGDDALRGRLEAGALRHAQANSWENRVRLFQEDRKSVV